ncbi:MBL fold metallo-hydrolase [Telluria sp. Tellsp104]
MIAKSNHKLLAALAFAAMIGANAQAADNSFVTLGTMGGPISSPERSQPSNVLLRDGKAYLVDAGDGTAQQLAKAGIPLGKIKAVFISHLHFDHTGGLAALLGLRYQTSVWDRLPIYGPPGTKDMVAGLIVSMQPEAASGYGLPGSKRVAPESTVEVIELTDGSKVDVDGIHVVAAQNTHYSFAPNSLDDRKFKSLSFRFDLPERSIVYTGDTGPSPAVERLAKGADLLVSEMIDLDSTLAKIRQNGVPATSPEYQGIMKHLSTHHLSPVQLGELAAQAGVKRVVVTHLAPGTTDKALIEGYVRGIHSKFNGPATIANDLDRF